KFAVQYDLVGQEPGYREEQPDGYRAEYTLPWLCPNEAQSPARHYVGEVAVYLEGHSVVVPCLAGPEPDPPRPSYESADEDQRYPGNESDQEGSDGDLALPPGVVADAERIRINVRERHESDEHQRWHHHTGDPRIKID